MEGRLDLERAVDGLVIHGAAQDAPLRGVALGQMNDLALFIVEAQTSPFGVVMMPCIEPSRPSKL